MSWNNAVCCFCNRGGRIVYLFRFQNEQYEYLDREEPFELQYGVSGMVREKQKEYRNQYIFWNIIATCICVASPIPLLVGRIFEQEFLITLLLTVTMVLAGIGACILW